MDEVLYTREGDLFLPSEAAGGPWNADAQHGGAASALLARALEAAADEGLRPVRLTVDLPRVLPRKPLSVVARPVRTGRRIALIDASIECDGLATSHARALFLKPSEAVEFESPCEPMPSPDGLEVGSLVRPERVRFTGLHTRMQVKWVVRDGPGTAAWFRLPMPVVAGEETTPFMRAAAISDFANAVAHRSVAGLAERNAQFINADLTVHLIRMPEGEWIGMRTEEMTALGGTGFVRVGLFDTGGRFGTCSESRLANSRD